MRRCVVVVVALVCLFAVPAFPQGKVVFDNQSGDPALVKLIGPTQAEVTVPTGAKVGTDAAAGRYIIKVRYGTAGKYHYAKGEEFDVKETATARSEITITLHKVVAGNYESHPISSEEFAKSGHTTKPLVKAPTAQNPTKNSSSSSTRHWEAVDGKLGQKLGNGTLILDFKEGFYVKIGVRAADASVALDKCTAEDWEVRGPDKSSVKTYFKAFVKSEGRPGIYYLGFGVFEIPLDKAKNIDIRLKGDDDWMSLDTIHTWSKLE